jgi:hypothetical protein
MSDITNILSTLSDEQIQDILAVSRHAKEQRRRDERRDSILPEEDYRRPGKHYLD